MLGRFFGFNYFSHEESDFPLTNKEFNDIPFTWPDTPEAEHVCGLGVSF